MICSYSDFVPYSDRFLILRGFELANSRFSACLRQNRICVISNHCEIKAFDLLQFSDFNGKGKLLFFQYQRCAFCRQIGGS